MDEQPQWDTLAAHQAKYAVKQEVEPNAEAA